MRRRTFLASSVSAATAALLAACGGASSTTVPQATAARATAVSATAVPATTGMTAASSAPMAAGGAKTTVKVAFSYIPNVQFAPFYIADARGRFAAEGIQTQYDYGTTTDFMQLVARGERDFLNASGDEVILARANGLPVVYVAAVYQQYPVVVFAPKGKGLTGPDALTKLKIGLPGLFGATYIGFKAILYASKIDEKQVNEQEIGFTQAQTVQAGKVDAAVGYANNEPLQLKAMGVDVDVLKVSDIYNLPSAGVVTSEKMLAERPEVVRGFLRGLLAGMRDLQAEPKAGFAEVLKIVPEAAKSADVQQQVLAATIDLCGDPTKYGAIDPLLWSRAVTFMRETGLLKSDVKPESLYNASYLPAK